MYLPSTDPADPETAALNLIIHAAEAATGSRAFRPVLQELAGVLQLEGALTGLVWADARSIAAAISLDAVTADDPAITLRGRATAVLAGRDGQQWANPTAVMRALSVAATVLDTC